MSCEVSDIFVNCSDCTVNEPYDVTIKCRIDVNTQNSTLVQLWEGKLEDNILVDSTRIFLTAGWQPDWIYNKTVPLNKHYTITATYIIDNKTYVAVGSVSPKIKHIDKCDEPCYYVYGNEVNLQLKYTK